MLLVLEQVTPGVDEFWVLPGGGLEPEDASIPECAKREFREETGLTVEVGPLLYAQEFPESDGQTRHLGLIFLVHSPIGELHQADRDTPLQGSELKRHVGWFTREQMQTIRIYPEALRDHFWQNRAAATPGGSYLSCDVRLPLNTP
jgi:ADP-ribose pyrophosphatase YjhB (NUDIX family)